MTPSGNKSDVTGAAGQHFGETLPSHPLPLPHRRESRRSSRIDGNSINQFVIAVDPFHPICVNLTASNKSRHGVVASVRPRLSRHVGSHSRSAVSARHACTISFFGITGPETLVNSVFS